MMEDRLNLSDTIVAISTPLGQAGIGIVRISGRKSLKIADKIFVLRSKKRPSECKTYSLHYGFIVNSSNKQVIDEALLSIMRAPKSYTKEDVVEINSHGGIVVLQGVLDAVINLGARLAEPGEFTKRAFLNGRIDLTQAEAVLDIINAKTKVGLKVAVDHLKGNLSKEIKKIRDKLVGILSSLEATIDFSQEELEPFNQKDLEEQLKEAESELRTLLETAKRGIILNEGLVAVLSGKANVGKSSIMNALIKKEKVIVTPLAGTTRDAIEEMINLKGIPLKIVDTAGILKPAGPIEEESVARSKNYLESADLIVLVLDNSQAITDEDLDIINRLDNKNIIVAINKIDLPDKINLDKVKDFFKDKRIVKISATKGKNLEKLEEAIIDSVLKGEVVSTQESIINSVRHKKSLKAACKSLEKAFDSMKKGLSVEFVVEDVREAIKYLGRITGQTTADEVLDNIFSKFCIGK